MTILALAVAAAVVLVAAVAAWATDSTHTRCTDDGRPCAECEATR